MCIKALVVLLFFLEYIAQEDVFLRFICLSNVVAGRRDEAIDLSNEDDGLGHLTAGHSGGNEFHSGFVLSGFRIAYNSRPTSITNENHSAPSQKGRRR